MYRFILIASLFSFTVPSFAQNTLWRFEQISEVGPEASVQSILQDSRGHLLIGTEEGLGTYDGYSFKQYPIESSGIESLPNTRVNALYEDNAGSIWIGQDAGGLSRYTPASGLLELDILSTYAAHIQTGGKTNVAAITGDEKGFIWVGTFEGLWRIDPTNMSDGSASPQAFSLIPDLQNLDIWTLVADQNGAVWVGTASEVLYRIDVETLAVDASTVGVAGDELRALHIQGDSLFIGFNVGQDETGKGGIYVQQISDGTRSLVSDDDAFRKVQSLVKGLANDLWVGTSSLQGRIFRLNLDTNQIVRFLPSETCVGASCACMKGHCMKSTVNRTLYVSKEGILWIGNYEGGLYKLILHQEKFGTAYLNRPESEINASIYAVHGTDDGHILFGTFGQGLIKSSRDGEVLALYSLSSSTETMGSVVAMVEEPKDILWLGSYGQGLYKFDLKRETVVAHTIFDESLYKSNINQIMGIYSDGSGILWLSTNGAGVIKYQTESGDYSVFKSPEGLNDFNFKVLADHEGNIVVGGQEGLTVVDEENEQLKSHESQFKYYIQDIDRDQNGDYWIGTKGEGLFKLDPNFEVIHHFTEEDGLPGNIIPNVRVGGLNNVWFTGEGIGKIDIESNLIKRYIPEITGVAEYNHRGNTRLNTGELVVAGDNGAFTVFSPSTTFQFERPVVEFISRSSLSAKESEHIEVDGKPIAMPIELRVLDFVSPGYNSCPAYRIVGTGDTWSECQNSESSILSLGRLKGKQDIEIKILNPQGVFTTTHAVFIPFGWWRQWPGLLSIALSVIVLFYGAMGYSAWRIGRRSRVEEENRERGRAFEREHQAFHLHALLSSLRAIEIKLSGLSESRQETELIGELEIIKGYNKKVRSEIRQLMDQLLDHGGEEDTLVEMMTTYTARVMSKVPELKVKQISEGQEREELSQVVKNRLQQIFTLALDNVAQHAEAKNVTIKTVFRKKDIQLSVRDDGKGFDVQSSRTNHGLRLMETLAAEIGADFSIKSRPDLDGTEVAVHTRLATSPWYIKLFR